MAVAYTLDELCTIAERPNWLAQQWVDSVTAVPTTNVRYQPPATLTVLEDIEPRERQLESAWFLRQKSRGCLWHVPGFGKTVCAAMAAVPPTGIACPTYLENKWANWLQAHVPSARGHIYVASGSYAKRIGVLREAWDDPHAWTIFNKEMWRPETKPEVIGGKRVLRAQHEDDNQYNPYIYKYPIPPLRTAILDEAHHYRVPNAWHSIGAQKLLLSAAQVFELTATPFYKVHTDLFMQLAILNPKQFTSFWNFAKRFAQLWDDGWTLKVSNSKNEGPLNELMEHYGLAYDYLEGECPDVIELDDIVVNLPSATLSRLRKMKEGYRDPVTGEIFTSASQVTNAMMRVSAAEPTKLEALTEFHMDNSRRFDMSVKGGLVLVQHIETANLVGRHLNKTTPYKWNVITGETPFLLRAQLAERADNVVGTLGAMSEGIDCSHLSLVHEYEKWYLPGATTQGVARSARERHASHPRALPDKHRNEPVLVQSYRLSDGPDKGIHNVATHRRHTNDALIDAIMKSV